MICLLSSITVHCGSWLPVQWSFIFSGLWPLYANFYFPSISPSFMWSSSFLYFFHSGSSYFFLGGILLLFVLSVCPYHFNLNDFVNFTMSAHCNISCIPYLFLFSIFLFTLWDHTFFLHSSF